jgi:PEGA domain
MALTKSFVAVAMFSSLALASPAFAQAHSRGGSHGGGGGNHGGGGGHVERSAPSGPSRSYSGPARTYSGPARTYSGPARSYNGPVTRSYVAPRVYNSRSYSYSPRVYAPTRVIPGRGYGAYSRSYYSPRVYSHVVGPVYRSYGYRYYGYPSYVYRPYLFRPHFSIGFGFFSGYAVPYAYSYPEYYPYAVPYPVPVPSYDSSNPYGSYGYPNTGYPQQYQQGSVTAQPGMQPGPTNSGGVSFEVNPPTAQVTVDGNYVGTVQNFDGSQQPLTLPIGNHRIELRADGYQTVTFDVNVLAGQVIPYRGDLQPE